jgi:hypothetical protein
MRVILRVDRRFERSFLDSFWMWMCRVGGADAPIATRYNRVSNQTAVLIFEMRRDK